jgi:hypothetical protein
MVGGGIPWLWRGGRKKIKREYLVDGLNIGPSVQQEGHGVHLATLTGDSQGRYAVLQRRGVGEKKWFGQES